MDKPQGEPPHAGERLTRDDVLHLIEQHGGPVGLDLRGADLRGADLSQLDLHGANLRPANLAGTNVRPANLAGANLQGTVLAGARLDGAVLAGADLRGAAVFAAHLPRANLWQAKLQGANVSGAQLQGAHLIDTKLQGADLRVARLQGAFLIMANLERADLRHADLRGARLAHASLGGASLENVNWGDRRLGDEMQGDFGNAASVYRALKQCHTELGMYDIAGEFHYREMEARRKLAWKEHRWPHALAMNALRFLYGYGERPERVIGWAAAVILGFALGHWLFGTVAGGFLDALYYSAVSFPALGYGHWAPEPQGWAGRFLGAGESFLGVFMMALFLVTFTRKMTR